VGSRSLADSSPRERSSSKALRSICDGRWLARAGIFYFNFSPPAQRQCIALSEKRPMHTSKSKLRFRIMAGRLPASKIWRGHRPFTAWTARVDAAAPSGGMAMVTAAWGMPAAVMVLVRVRT
jgi:hypothetical protein